MFPIIAGLVIAGFSGCLIAPVLGVLGFSAIGPVAGSTAAWWQSVFGVSAVFSFLQSVPMLGYGAPVLYGAVQGLGLGIAGIGAVLKIALG